MTNLTPSAKGAFFAGIGLWLLLWAVLFKADDIAELGHISRWVNSERCFRWIRAHKTTTLLGTECCNYAHSGMDPLGVTFALGGTLTNFIVIYIVLPLLYRANRGGKTLDLKF